MRKISKKINSLILNSDFLIYKGNPMKNFLFILLVLLFILSGLAFSAEQNQPNPFDNTTTINYYVPSHYQGTIEFVVADNQGISIMDTQVATLDKPASIVFSSNNYDTGVYLYGIRVDGKIVKSKKMMIVK